jgi:predicted nuclease with RNAse H fold
VFVGIDLTAGARPSAAAALSDNLSLAALELLRSDEELREFASRHGAEIVAIDAPLSLPRGQCCLEPRCGCQSAGPGQGRACERALSRLGIGCYYTTKRSIIKTMVYRGMRLKAALEGSRVAVLEVYPYATKVRTLGRPLPRKSSAAGRAYFAAALSQLLGQELGLLDHDQADALFCAYTAWLHARGRTEALGSLGEGQIHIPLRG